MCFLNARTQPLVFSILGLSLLTAATPGFAAPKAPLEFELPRWETGEKVKLRDFAGEIIILDFFAYWCGPCRRASEEIEKGIRKYYAAKQGNAHGVAVRVLSINIEKDNPKLTAQFIRQTGAEDVLNDFDGALLAKLGGAATPFLVLIDGTHATSKAADFRMVYKNAGFEGTKKLRQIIDGIKPPKTASSGAAAIERATDAPTLHKGDASFEAMLASDIQITSTAFSYGQQKGGTEWKLRYAHNTIGADYLPFAQFDFLGFAERIETAYNSGQASVRQRLKDGLTLSVSGGDYSGFTDYRSLWLANYYKQQFANFFPGQYAKPDPQGFNAATGLRWEYLPTIGFAQADFVYSNDEIAPGYERDPNSNQLIRGREILHTYAPMLKFENVLTSRIRALNEFQLTITSGREPRYSYRGSANAALGERWTWRTQGGYTQEDPTLRAWFAGSTLEYEITPQWLVSISGLYYRDTGEIENSLLISTAAPGLQTYQGGIGLRYISKWSSFSLSVSPVRANYEPVNIGTRPFNNLYKDRTWIAVQAAWALEF